MIKRLFLLVFAGALSALAQTQIPAINPTPDNIQLFSYPQRFIHQLLNDQSQLFVNEGLLYATGLLGLVLFGVAARQLLSNQVNPEEFLVRALRYGIVMMLLTFYTTPTPFFGGSSVSTVLPNFAEDMSALVNLAGMNGLLDRTNTVMKGLSWGTFFDVERLLACFGAWSACLLMQLTVFLFNMVPLLSVGCCALIGPVFIPFYITDKFEWLFWSWFRAMLVGSLATLTSTIACFVYTNSVNAFLDAQFSGNFDLAHLTVNGAYFVLFAIFGFFAVGVVSVGLPIWLVSGGGHHGHGSMLNIAAARMISFASR